MMYVMVSVKDSAVDCYGRPWFARSEAEAVRVFADEVNRDDPNNLLRRHPGDYALFRIGEWDDDTGEPTAEHSKKLAEASALLKE